MRRIHGLLAALVAFAGGCVSLSGLAGGNGGTPDAGTGTDARDASPLADGGRDAETKDVADSRVTEGPEVAAPPPQPFVKDTFARTVADGLGTAEIGGAWVLDGTSSLFAVSPGAATVTMAAPSIGSYAYLGSTRVTSADIRLTISQDKLADGSGSYVSLIGRWISDVQLYEGKVHIGSGGTTDLTLSKLDGSATVELIEQLTISTVVVAGSKLNLRLQVDPAGATGTTSLAMKAWPDTSEEPSAWQLTGTDTTPALQVAGSVGIGVYLGGTATNAPVVESFSALSAAPVE
jgi:hypothetical protein